MRRGLLVSTLLSFSAALAAEGGKPPALPFIENDYDKALAAAKTAERPLFVEVWAPW